MYLSCPVCAVSRPAPSVTLSGPFLSASGSSASSTVPACPQLNMGHKKGAYANGMASPSQ